MFESPRYNARREMNEKFSGSRVSGNHYSPTSTESAMFVEIRGEIWKRHGFGLKSNVLFYFPILTKLAMVVAYVEGVQYVRFQSPLLMRDEIGTRNFLASGAKCPFVVPDLDRTCTG
jgi:hypothetical protein